MLEGGAGKSVREITTTKQRRNSFFNYATQAGTCNEAVFFLLVEAYRKKPRKSQAEFLNDAFVQGKDMGQTINTFSEGGINIGPRDMDKAALSRTINTGIESVGRSFHDKVEKNGLITAVTSKILRDPTGLDANIFDVAQDWAASNVWFSHCPDATPGTPQGIFNASSTYQTNARYKVYLFKFQLKLTSLGFNWIDLGIY